jgi:hypothetical protein
MSPHAFGCRTEDEGQGKETGGICREEADSRRFDFDFLRLRLNFRLRFPYEMCMLFAA